MTPAEFQPNAVHYKIIELSTVTDETIEGVLNEWTSRGWIFDQIQFVVRDASRRPSMAFLFFIRPVATGEPATFEQIAVKTEEEIEEASRRDSEESDEGDIIWS